MDKIENFAEKLKQEINLLNQKLENHIQLEAIQIALAEILQFGAEKLNNIETEKNIFKLSQKIKKIYFKNYLIIKLNQWINTCLKPIKSAINLNSNTY